MSSKKKIDIKSRWDTFRYSKQSLVGKIILISSVFLFGSFLVYVLLTISLNRWDDLGIYSVWIIFGWFFFIILVYVSFKLISLLMHKEKSDKQKSENNKITQNSVSSSKKSDHHDD